MGTKLIAHYAIRETLELVVMGVALFWAAGQIDWRPAWAAIAVMLAWMLAGHADYARQVRYRLLSGIW